MNYKHFFCCLLLMSGARNYCQGMLINAEGIYQLGGDISYTASIADDTIFEIAANNVILDLGGFTISQDGLSPSPCNGIVVAPGMSNVTIRNGQIQDITGTGIGIGYGCSHIIIENIITNSCDLRALSLNGIPDAPIGGVAIIGFAAAGCGQGIAADVAIGCSECVNITTEDVEIAYCGATSHDYSGLMLFDVCCSKINDVTIDSIFANTVSRGYNLTGVTDSVFSNCFCRGGSVNSGGTSIGFDLINSCSHLAFNECIALSQGIGGVGVNSYGFRVQQGNDDNLISQCIVTNASGDSSATGILVEGNDIGMIECIVQKCTSTTGTAVGIACTAAYATKTIDCLSIDHVSSNTAIGYYFSNCTDCFTQLSVASNVTGGTDAQTFGFYLSGGSGNVFISNVSSRNGSSANSTNQFFGFNSFSQSVVSVSTSGPGNVAAPWINIGLI